MERNHNQQENEDLERDDNQQENEELERDKTFDLNSLFLEGENIFQHLGFNRPTSNGDPVQLNVLQSLTDSSSFPLLSQSHFYFLESLSSLEEQGCDKVKEQSNASIKKWDEQSGKQIFFDNSNRSSKSVFYKVVNERSETQKYISSISQFPDKKMIAHEPIEKKTSIPEDRNLKIDNSKMSNLTQDNSDQIKESDITLEKCSKQGSFSETCSTGTDISGSMQMELLDSDCHECESCIGRCRKDFCASHGDTSDDMFPEPYALINSLITTVKHRASSNECFTWLGNSQNGFMEHTTSEHPVCDSSNEITNEAKEIQVDKIKSKEKKPLDSNEEEDNAESQLMKNSRVNDEDKQHAAGIKGGEDEVVQLNAITILTVTFIFYIYIRISLYFVMSIFIR